MTDATQYRNAVPAPVAPASPGATHLQAESPGALGDPKAAVGRRIVAGILDLLVLSVLAFALASLFGGATAGGGEVGIQLTGGPAVLMFALGFGYYIAFEGLRGQTPGKMVLGIRVISADGARASWGAIVIRTLLRIVDGFFFYLVGLIVMLATSRKQRVGDLAAKTIVVRK